MLHVLGLLLTVTTAEVVRPPFALDGIPLDGGGHRRWSVALKAGSVLLGRVMQRGIDVVVTIRDPRGSAALEVDSPNGTSGHEPIIFVAAEGGAHVVEVRALAPDAPSGRFDLELETVRAATTDDRDVATALVLQARAMGWRTEALRRQAQADFPTSSRLYADAYRAASEALQRRSRALGADHLDVAATAQLLGLITDEVGDYAEGKAHFERALAILEKHHGVGDARTLTTRSDLGYLALANGDWAQAEALFTEVNAAREKLLGEAHPLITHGLLGLGEALLRRGDLARAEQVLRRGISLRERTPGATPSDVAWFGTTLGRVLAARGAGEEAKALCQSVVATAGNGGQLHRAAALACLGEVELRAGRPREALPHLRAALEIREAAGGPDHPWVGEALLRLGLALRAAGDEEDARRHLERAATVGLRRLRPGHPLRQEVGRALKDS